MQAAVKVLLLLSALPFGLFATSSVVIRSGPPYAGIIHPEEDCNFKNKMIAAIRIEKAILNEDGKEIGRAVVGSCSKTGSTEEYWFYTLDERGKVTDTRQDSTRQDNRGRIVEIITRTWDDGRESVERYHTTYDSDGRLLEGRRIESDGETHTSRYTYEDGGNMVVSTEFNKDGKVESVSTSRYNDQHHLLAETRDKGTETRYKYDVRGRLVEEVWRVGGSRSTYLYTYDEQGRPLSKRLLVGPSQQNAWVGGFSYWSNGLIKDEWLFRSPASQSSFDPPGLTLESYAYDEHDRLTQEWVYRQTREGLPQRFLVPVDGRLEIFGSSNGLRSFAYTYDSHGNWIKAVETQLSDPDEPASEREVAAITYRQIGYR
jgi:YD repeat-containing protein